MYIINMLNNNKSTIFSLFRFGNRLIPEFKAECEKDGTLIYLKSYLLIISTITEELYYWVNT